MIAVDWMKVKNDKEWRVMIKKAEYARILTIFAVSLMFLGLNLLTVLPYFGTSVRYRSNITDPGKLLPLQTYYIYDINQSPYYELTYAAQTLMALIAIASYSGVDTLFGLLVFHLCGQMENLKEKLIDMGQFSSFNDGLVFVVKDHMRLIKFSIAGVDMAESTTRMLSYLYRSFI